MKKYCVVLQGDNVALEVRRWFRRRRMDVGFYTTRWVVAGDEAAAEAAAIALVRAELLEQKLSSFDGGAIPIRLESIDELSSFEGVNVPGRGFTFYPAGS